MTDVIVYLPLNEAQRARLQAAAPDYRLIYDADAPVTEQQLSEAQIILGNPEEAGVLRFCRRLRWIHLSYAGADAYVQPGVLPEGALLANGTGAYGPAISEYMIAGLFAQRKKLDIYGRQQAEHLWQRRGQVPMVAGCTVLVLGLGDIGSCFARSMKALGCHVIGVKRRPAPKPDWLDALYTEAEVTALIPEADVIAMSLPGTAQTYHFMSRERIGLMKKDAILINVGRGMTLDTEALCTALYAGRIGGAVLDVLETEPLPADHPLWDAPRTIITPHASGRTMQPETLDRIVDMFAENLRLDAAGQPIRYLVDLQTGYRAGR